MQNDNKLTEIKLYLADEDDTVSLAKQFAPMVCGTHPAVAHQGPGGRIYLKGDLGTGKTSFVRALLHACGITEKIKSPSYTLLETYNLSNLYFYHLDFYRLRDSREWLDAGFRDILQKKAIVLIEWPEQAGELLPPPDLEINLDYVKTGRQARLTAHSTKGTSWLTSLVLPLQGFPPKDSPGDA
ncbi:MAG: tRNA (adenosine(37)-N6)-threonylcarbamoyltransferase complex ATPase subunit type 1 TsaE [Burkholderiaceae bacterium]|nr:MAG: tRNA (adenosine(37)-N6)-threonylcarbamoyltransferase complex ATPase subunit type 1 TsaE [Burkholderiaceae bacterium]